MKTFTQFINETTKATAKKALVGRALRTVNPKNIKDVRKNIQKAGRTSQLLAKKMGPRGELGVRGMALDIAGEAMQDIAPNAPYREKDRRWKERVWKDV